jgi:hypothetical protein
MSYPVTVGAQDTSTPVRTSELLREFSNSITSDRVTVGEIVAALGGRGLGVLLAIFSLPNVLPSAVPFGNIATGIPPLIFTLQLVLGFDRLILPHFVARQTIATTTLQALIPRVAAVLAWFERLLRPRLCMFTTPHAERLFGILGVLLAIAGTLPIPFGHQIPSFGLVMMGLAMIEDDGLSMILGAIIGTLGLVFLGLLVFGLAHGVGFLLHLHL